MRKSGFTEEQIIRILKEQEAGQPTAAFAKLQVRCFQSPAAPSANLPVAEKAVA